MPVKISKQGRYKRLKTTHGHELLELGGEYYARVQGQRGEILVRSDRDHEFETTLERGRYRYVEFNNDPEFKDMPHLFLQQGDTYREIMLPNGLPTRANHQKKLIETGNTPATSKIDGYLANPAAAGPGEKAANRARGSNEPNLPVTDYASKTVEEVKREARKLSKDELRQVKRHEQKNKDRATAERSLERELERRNERNGD